MDFDLNFVPDLTAEERKEIADHPIGKPNDGVNWNWDIRVAIAFKLSKLVKDYAMENDPKLLPLYEQYAPHWLYTDGQGKAIWRLTAISIDKDTGNWMAETRQAAETVDKPVTRLLAEIVHVDQWASEQRIVLESGLIAKPEYFLDPLGFILIGRK
jgi:hypothetical protein